jgi:hypothetical protein
MRLIELTDFVKEVYKYFKDQKVPKQDVLELWLKQVESIPAPSLDFIQAYIKKTRNSLPTNFPRVIDDGWKAYQKEYPEKFTLAQEVAGFNCPDCHGGGVLHCKALDLINGLKYTYVAICASCSASRDKFGFVLHEGGKISLKTDSGAFIPSGAYIPPVLSLTKQLIIDKGWEFLEPENQYAKTLDKIPDSSSYTKLKKYQRLIRETHHQDLARQAEGLIGEGFTKHEAVKVVDQAIELRAKEARGSDNPGDIVKKIFDI